MEAEVLQFRDKSAEPVKPAGRAIMTVDPGALTVMVQEAANKLAAASSAAEVLDAHDKATTAYDAAQSAARLLIARGAHDKLVAATHRVQADALDIEAGAKRRLADEYDEAQERGELRKAGRPKPGAVSGDVVGVSAKQVFEARRVRNAMAEKPTVVREALDELLDQGKEPTRGALMAKIAPKPPREISFNDPIDVLADLMDDWERASSEQRAQFLINIGATMNAKE